MKTVISFLFTFIFLICAAQPTGYLGQRLNGTNMTNQSYVYNSPGTTPTTSRLVQEYRDSTYGRWLYNTIRFDALASAIPIYIKTDAMGNLIKAPITDIFNAANYYTKAQQDVRYLQSFTESDPIFVADSSLYGRKAWALQQLGGYYTKTQADGRFLQSFTELDPVFSFSPAFGITSTNLINWNAAYGWGDHSAQNYLKSTNVQNGSGLVRTVSGNTVSLAADPTVVMTQAQAQLIIDNMQGQIDNNTNGKVSKTTTIGITFNGTNVTQDLSANRTFVLNEVDASITNELELPSQSGQGGKVLGTNGTTPVWQTASAGTVTSVGVTSSTLTVSNSPVISAGTVTVNLPSIITAGTYGLTTVDQYGRVTGGKRQETYSGTTNASGNYTVTFATPYSVAPNIQCQVIGGSTETFFRVTSVTTTGFTVNAFTRGIVTSLPVVGTLVSSLLGGTTTPLSAAAVDVLITEK